jgi:hypothetical protein
MPGLAFRARGTFSLMRIDPLGTERLDGTSGNLNNSYGRSLLNEEIAWGNTGVTSLAFHGDLFVVRRAGRRSLSPAMCSWC